MPASYQVTPVILGSGGRHGKNQSDPEPVDRRNYESARRRPRAKPTRRTTPTAEDQGSHSGELRDATGSNSWPAFRWPRYYDVGEFRGAAVQGAAHGGDEADESMAIMPTDVDDFSVAREE